MYRPTSLLAALAVLAAAAAPEAGPKTTRAFTEDAGGAPPAGFLITAPRPGPPDRWIVQREGDERFLAHAATPGGSGYSLAILQDLQHQHVEIAVRLKLVGGHRSGGFVWRYRDPENFYMARIELSDREMGLYRVVNGNRIRIDVKDDLELDPNGWHALKVVQNEQRIRVYLGGIKVFDDKDRTFTGPGGVGLWSSVDSASY